MEKDIESRRSDRVASVDRAVDALVLLAEYGPAGRSLSELANRLGSSKSSTLALLETLRARDIVVNDSQGAAGVPSRYRLGSALMWLGEVAGRQAPLVDIARRAAQALAEALGLSVRFSVFDGLGIVGVYRVNGLTDVFFANALGKREMLHCTAAGKAILAEMSDAQIAAIVDKGGGLPARTRKTITDIAGLLSEIDKVRVQGYAVDDEEDIEGIVCIGASVVDAAGVPIGALSVTELRVKGWDQKAHALGLQVRQHANEMSKERGYRMDAPR